MSTHTHNQLYSLDIYNQSPSLLFQFILNEFLETYQESQKIEQTYRQMESMIIKNRLLAEVEEYIYLLLDSLTQLTGSSLMNEDSFPWSSDNGSLSKLHHYCYFFAQSSPFNEKASANLNICVSKAFHSSLQSRETVLTLMQEQMKGNQIPDYATLYKLLDRLIDNMHRASRLLLQILIKCQDDENIVFFLFRHQKRFSDIYKPSFFNRILNKMYPCGLKDAKEFLINRYAQRGFQELLETISSLSDDMSKLEKDSPFP